MRFTKNLHTKVTFVIDRLLMMAQSRAESTWEINNYGKYINQLPPNTIKSIRRYERTNKKIWGQKMCIMFNEICIYYIYIYIVKKRNRKKNKYKWMKQFNSISLCSPTRLTHKRLVGWLVLWHINICRLFNAKSCLYIYIKYIGFVNIFCG